MQVHIPALHPQSKLTTLRCKGMVCIVVDFWDLISAPVLMDLKIECLRLVLQIILGQHRLQPLLL